jgi:peroxiredoxin
MAKMLLPFLATLLPATAHAALVAGTLKNAAPGLRIEVFVPHAYLDGRDNAYRGELNGQQQFSIEVEVPMPQMVLLQCGDDRLPIFLAPDDTLLVRADAFQFPLAVNFGGKAAANNRLFQQFLQENPQDYNEFNNLRFKIGQYWASVEEPMNSRMEALAPQDFKAWQDSTKARAFALLDDFVGKNPGALSPAFADWMAAEITYAWAYHLVFYGQVYAGRHGVTPDFFDFLYEAPTISEQIGSAWYRQFLLALMARQQAKTGQTDHFWAGQYQQSGEILSGEPLAFFRSEMIQIAFSGERYREILPLYTHFLQTNTYPRYDEKVEGLYQKFARVLPGSPAPPFEATDAAGHLVSLARLRGKVVYLNFWASWCGACLRKMEFFDDYQPELARRGVEVVNVSIDENPNNWQNALAERNFRGQQIIASAAKGRNIANIYGVEAVPQYFIIGRDGNFADKASSSQPADIRQKLLEIAEKQ